MRKILAPRKIALLVLVLVLVILYFALDLDKYATFDALQSTRDTMTRLYASHGLATVAVFMAAYIALSALALPGQLVLTLVAGAVFGVPAGTLYTTFAGSLGGSLAFLGTRYIFAEMAREKLGAKLEKIDAELEKEGMLPLLFLRLVLVFPFTLVNIAAGLTAMPHRTFFLGTFLGILIPNLILCYAGAGIVSITGVRDIFSLRVMGALFLLGLLSLAPVLYRKARQRNQPGR